MELNTENKYKSEELTWDYKYNDDGYLVELAKPGCKLNDFSYDFFPGSDNRIRKIEETNIDGKVTRLFNYSGQLLEMNDPAGSSGFAYNKSGYLKTYKRNNSSSVSYVYNSSGETASLSINNKYQIEYIYDFRGRLTSLKTPAGKITYAYLTGDAIIVRSLPNGIKTQYKYLPEGNLESITHIDKNNYILSKYSYNYNAEDLIENINEWTPRGENHLYFEYDNEGRLIAFTNGNDTKTEYKYDGFGNRLETVTDSVTTGYYSYDWLGRMLTANGNTCKHDEAGNLCSAEPGTEEFKFNGSNQLRQINNTIYKYDGNGFMVARNSENQKTTFLNNPLSQIWQPILACTDKGEETFYIWEGNTPLAIFKNGKADFFLTDHLGSVRGIINDQGLFTQELKYSPFGVPQQPLNKNGLYPGFTGLFYEPEAGLYLTKARAYNPSTGRFLQIDPLHQTPTGSQKDLSVYGYCGGDPVNFVDIEGTKATSLHEKWRVFASDPAGEFTNWWGKGTFMGGKRRSGSKDPTPVGQVDQFGEYPVGIPDVPISSLSVSDKIYARHDFQYFVNEHYRKGDIVKVNTKDGFEYYKSAGHGHQTINNVRLIVEDLLTNPKSPKFNPIIHLLLDYCYDNIKSDKLPSGYSEQEVKNLSNNPDEWTRELSDPTASDIGGSHYKDYLVNSNPIEIIDSWDRFANQVLDYYFYGNIFNQPLPLGNNPISNELFTSAIHDLYNQVNPAVIGFDNYKYEFLKAFFEQMSRDVGIHQNYIPNNYSPDILKYVHAAYKLFRDIPKLNGLSITGKLDVLDNFTKFSLSPTSWIITPVLKGYWGLVFNYLNYNPADQFMNRYGNVQTSYDPERNSTTTTSSVSYREVTIAGYKRIIPINSDNNEGPSSTFNSSKGIDFTIPTIPSPLKGKSIEPPTSDHLDKNNDNIGFLGASSSPPPPPPPPPGNIGGIYLSGAAKSLEGLGQISGIAIDKTSNKLVLLSEDKGEINLPALRLDDVVTVFKSVYQQGEAPFVSIDPNPKNPKGPIMLTRHGKITNNTYVGWILFEADRIMKAYSLGEDNITKKAVESDVAGYDTVLETKFASQNTEQTWERYWIVPARVEKSNSANNELSLMEIPLKVKTQKMVLQKGKLEPAPDGKTSKGAKAFSEWFTTNYDKIAEESYSLPPDGSGFNQPVPVFKELKRIAMVTAIAEHLRDNDVEFPFWMRSYNISTFAIPETTPAHTVVRKNGNSVLTVYGGVNLSPSDEDVVIKTDSAKANQVYDTMTEKIKPLFEPVNIKINDKPMQLIALPGTTTKALMPCRLNETDLSLKITDNYYLNLTRKFNSFTKPLDNLFGDTWSLDLPILEKQKVPVKRNGDGGEYTYSYRLISPLNSISEKIDQLYVGNIKEVGKTTFCVQNKVKLHFNDDGFLVAREEKPLRIIYKRDKNNLISQITAYWGNKARVGIKLKYDNKGRLAMATADNGDFAKYSYSPHNQLEKVTYKKTEVNYAYKNNLVTAIKRNKEFTDQFSYNEKGQLLNETRADGLKTLHNVSAAKEGFLVSSSNASDNDVPNNSTSLYDSACRLVKQSFPDGSEVAVDYPEPDSAKIKIAFSSGDEIQINKSNGNKNIQYQLPNGTDFNETYDDDGKLISLHQNDQPVFQHKWNPGGLLAQTTYPTHSEHFEYNDEGLLRRTLTTPPGDQDSWSEWQSHSYNNEGKLTETADNSGAKTEFKYDKDGALNTVQSGQGKVEFQHKKGLVKEIETSWGVKSTFTYDKENNFKEIIQSKNGNHSVLSFKNEQLREIKKNDGSKLVFDYAADKNGQALIERVTTPLNTFEYGHNKNDLITDVNCNDKYKVRYLYDKSARVIQIKVSP